jgi:hypothetical protein
MSGRKIKAGEKMAKNSFAELKRIKVVLSSKRTGGEYSFLNAPLKNFLAPFFLRPFYPRYDLQMTLDKRK